MSVVPKEEARREVVAEHIPRSVTVLLTVMFLVAVVVAGVLVAFPYLHLHRGVFRTMARYVPFPAMIVDGDLVWYRELSERANALEALADMEPGEAMAQAVVLAERHSLLWQLADELAVEVSESERDAVASSTTALALLQSKVVWTERDYLRHGVTSYALAAKVEDALLASSEWQSEARSRAERIVDKRAQGIPFYNLAVQYSEGQSAPVGGDLGYVDPVTLPASIAAFAETAGAGAESGVLETAASFWLVRAEDVMVGDDGQRLVWLRVIEIKKDLLADILDDRLRHSMVIQFLR